MEFDKRIDFEIIMVYINLHEELCMKQLSRFIVLVLLVSSLVVSCGGPATPKSTDPPLQKDITLNMTKYEKESQTDKREVKNIKIDDQSATVPGLIILSTGPHTFSFDYTDYTDSSKTATDTYSYNKTLNIRVAYTKIFFNLGAIMFTSTF